ncbi:hypothetical protein ACN27F_14310 [Solwaraspora sp. WMMB335]|uniref:hypothetical protein n=1 Tax=Solwaraspora sp. WMMB335 TaxID=3404118 RepID=UPI003B93AD59
MRTLVKAAVAAAVLVGTMTATGTAAVAAEPSTSTTTSVQAVDWYYGYGSGSTANSAYLSAKYQAENWAWIGGYTPIIDCFVASSYVTPVSDYYYTANVTLICY